MLETTMKNLEKNGEEFKKNMMKMFIENSDITKVSAEEFEAFKSLFEYIDTTTKLLVEQATKIITIDRKIDAVLQRLEKGAN